MFEEGRTAWPDVALARDLFDAYVLERVPEGDDGSKLHAGELYLACACAHGSRDAFESFEARFLGGVSTHLAGMGATEGFVDEVRQEVRERLFVENKIRQYSGRGSLASWLRVVTVRVALNLREKDRAHDEVDDALPGAAIDPELAVIQRRYGPEFRAAIRDALAGLDPEDRGILRLYYLDGLNIARIGAVFKMSRATVGRRMITIRERMVEDCHRLLRERLHATPEELESLLRLVRSDLALSVSAVLREGGA